jgi:hypothetical protein
LDRNLEERTGELRVIATDVRVPFAFLLIVPFNTGFAHVGGFERIVYQGRGMARSNAPRRGAQCAIAAQDWRTSERTGNREEWPGRLLRL